MIPQTRRFFNAPPQIICKHSSLSHWFTAFPAAALFLISRTILSFAVSGFVLLEWTLTRKVVEPRRLVKRYGSEAQDISFSRELFNVFMPPAPFLVFLFLFSDIPQVPPLRSVVAHFTDFVSGYFLNRLPICPGDTHHYRGARRLRFSYFSRTYIISPLRLTIQEQTAILQVTE